MSSESIVPNQIAESVIDSPSTPLPMKPQRAVSPRLRIVLFFVLGLFSLLTANGLYLSSITFLQWWKGIVYENYFYQLMFLLHLLLGFAIVMPVIVFGLYHWKASHKRRNKRAIRIGYALLLIAILVLVSGILLTRIGTFEFMKGESARRVTYWLHIITPLMAVWFYWLHRLVGPKIKWYIAQRIGIATAVFVGSMVILQMQDPRDWTKQAPKEGDQYFYPSLARTRTGNFISEQSLMNDDYCKSCHQDVYNDWFHSAHHFSSFNNPAYLYAVRETRKVAYDRDGSVQAARWCAGCHDPVPFFTGAFDDPKYDDVNHSTSQAGITCTVCHAITKLNSNRGNSDYVIEEPIHYPFVYSENSILQNVNQLLVKAKPAFHKAEMLKPLHKTAEFCSTCHKVHLPGALTNYKEFLRGQNHYDSYLLSGVAGHGSRSFYYPPQAETNCNHCHMPFKESSDFGARYSEEIGKLAVHSHFFPAANTALPYWRGEDDYVELAQSILKGCARVDLFGVREEGTIEGKLIAPLRPEVPALAAGKAYLLESVIRTLKVGHHLTQGTVDSNELWLEITAKSGERVIGVSGARDGAGKVDPWAHFVNNFMIDKNGDRIARRNAQDIFVALYDHQIPPGAGQVAHYRLEVPSDISAPIEVTVRLNYRKFDKGYIDFMNAAYKDGDRDFRNRSDVATGTNELPITLIAEDRVLFPVVTADGRLVTSELPSSDPPKDLWQRWNDYGIGLLLTGNTQLRQAAVAFEQVEALGRSEGAMNLARVYQAEGSLDLASEALQRASKMTPPPAPWTFAWLSGEVARQQGQLKIAYTNFRSVLYDQTQERIDRKFDFSLDYVVRNQLGLVLIDLADNAEGRNDGGRTSKDLLKEAMTEFEKVLEVDSENNTAHANLRDLCSRMVEFAADDAERDALFAKSKLHGDANLRYKADDNAANLARPAARAKYPWADHASEQLVIYSLHREGAPEVQLDSILNSVDSDSSMTLGQSGAAPVPTATTQEDSKAEEE